MDDPAMKQYFADSPPTMVKLEIEPHFSNLSEREKAYAHHMSRLVDMSRLLSFIDVPTYQANPLMCYNGRNNVLLRPENKCGS